MVPVLWCRAALGQMESTLPLCEILGLRRERAPAPSAQSKFTGMPGPCSPQVSPPTPAGTRAGGHLSCQGFWPCEWLGRHHGLHGVLLWAWRSSCWFLAGPSVTARIAQGSGGVSWQPQLPLPEEIHCAWLAQSTSGVL